MRSSTNAAAVNAGIRRDVDYLFKDIDGINKAYAMVAAAQAAGGGKGGGGAAALSPAPRGVPHSRLSAALFGRKAVGGKDARRGSLPLSVSIGASASELLPPRPASMPAEVSGGVSGSGNLNALEEEQKALRKSFIQKKQAVRALIKMVVDPTGGIQAGLEAELKTRQATFRDIDAEWKLHAGMKERVDLVAPRMDGEDRRPLTQGDGRVQAGVAGGGPNDAPLGAALELQTATTEKLRSGLTTVVETRVIAADTAAQLAADREKIERIDKGLDAIGAELAVSRKLLTRFVKRIYTDKIIIALTTLVVLAIVAVILIATLKPGGAGAAFNVPDVLKPPVVSSGGGSTSAAAAGGGGSSGGTG